MNHVNRRRLKVVALLLAGLAFANSAWALNAGDMLTIQRFTPGGIDLPAPGANVCPPVAQLTPYPAGNGSCFGMEVNEPDIIYTRLRGLNGIVIGSAQPASGTHTGVPTNPMTEIPGIDLPWSFFSNAGLHYTAVPVTQIIPNSVLNFSGWTVTWNGIPTINMGTGAHGEFAPGDPFVNGQARIVCNPVNCPNGATYTLAYTATVPPGDISGFGGVKYSLRLEGYVIVPGSPQTLPASLPVGIAAGGVAGTVRVTKTQLTGAGIPDDIVVVDPINGNTVYNATGGYYDFVTPTTVAGGTTQVVLPLTAGLHLGFVYRKYKVAGGWSTFVQDANNIISSAPFVAGAPVGGTCPAPGDVAYVSPATMGHNCLQLTIVDGGPNDADGLPNGSVKDPGGVAVLGVAFVDTRVTGDSGCSLSANPVNPLERGDWWLLLGFVAWLGFVIRRKRA